MTSMFDQYEQADSSRPNNYSSSTAEMALLGGYINMTLEQDVGIFTKSKKDFSPSEKITHVAIANKYMVVAMANGMLFRMNLQNPLEHNEVNISGVSNVGRLMNLFLDPTGNHLLLTFAQRAGEAASCSELLYLSKRAGKCKPATKFRGHEFSAVAWNVMNESEAGTGPILLGTTKGLIFETEIALDGDKFFTSGFSSNLEQYWRQVFDIGKGSINSPITGLECFPILGTNHYAILAATPTKLYYFTGKAEPEEKPLLQQVFNRYLNIAEGDTFIECDSNLRYSKLQLWSNNLTTPDSLVWITEKKIFYCSMDFSLQSIECIKANLRSLPYPKPRYEDYSVSQKHAIAVCLTKFHVLLAYSDSIKGVCLLNQELVYEDNYNEAFGKLINVVKDSRTGTIWAITENAVFRFKVTKEARNVWKIFCDNNDFEQAKIYAKMNNEACYNQVLVKEAEKLFNDKLYEASAERYAETQSSFEEITLKFLSFGQSDSLKLFLLKKLQGSRTQDKTQITMLVIWLVELFLTKLEEKRFLDQMRERDLVQKEFETFLTSSPVVVDCIKKNKKTIYDLMASHGDKYNLIKLTIVNKDFEQLIRQHIYKNNFHEALDVLKSQNHYELYYQFAPILMDEVPKFMSKTLIEQGRKLSPLRLLPAFVTCREEFHAREVIRYLEFVTEKLGNSDKAIHNFLLSLYVKYDSDKLKSYLNHQGQEISLISYDVHFALRLCQDNNLLEACVQLSGLLNLWETSVDLALKIDLNLAKKMANLSPENDLELRKKLWLKIAQNSIKENDDIQTAINFLKQCDLLRIEDILPFFSDFVTIDHFKEAICNSLREYNDHIKTVKEEMEDATKSAELVRQEIQTFRNRFAFVNANSFCEICEQNLMVQPFYLFPCKHNFHAKCLLNEVEGFLGPVKRARLSELELQLRKLTSNSNQTDSLSSASGSVMSTKDLIKNEIDNIVASECLFCGENMIRNIDKPFIEDNLFEEINNAWK